MVFSALGTQVSSAVFDKLSHVVEYALNKAFGKNESAQIINYGTVIVSLSTSKSWYRLQNVALAALVSKVSFEAFRTLLSFAGAPSLIAHPFLIGIICGPFFSALVNTFRREIGVDQGRWVVLSDQEVRDRGIHKGDLTQNQWQERVYFECGAEPQYVPGTVIENCLASLSS